MSIRHFISARRRGFVIGASIAILFVAALSIVFWRVNEPLHYAEEGMASWYGPGFEDKKTASGGTFHTYDYTAAHRTLPMGSIVEVTNLERGYSAYVRIDDRGPYAGDRIIDLSRAAARAIGMESVVRVKLEGISQPRHSTPQTP